MKESAEQIAIIDSAWELAGRYDLWLCDVWGVIHNGREAFGDAVSACAAFRATGGTVILLTNAPRPSESVRGQLDALGVDRAGYDAIVSSGDVTRHLIEALGGRPAFHLGPERDVPIFAELAVNLTGAESAEVVINTGLYDDTTETPDDYRDLLAGFRARDLDMICANPDIRVERGSELVYCAGALAKAYQAIGGNVAYAGKPYLPIYDLAMERAGALRGEPLARGRALAIGDGLATDILGAANAGIDALFVRSGVHVAGERALDSGILGELFADTTHRLPVAAIDTLVW